MTDPAISAPHDGRIPDAETRRAVRDFMARVEKQYPAAQALLFGSRARGTHGPDSDADLAVILRGNGGNRTATALDMAGMAFETLLETGILVEALPLWEDELSKPATVVNSDLLTNIRREGLPM